MAITTLRQVNGDGTGTGTGAAVTWPTSGNPSYPITGCYYTNAEGTGFTNLTTASDRGIHYAWNAQGDGDDQPSWATGPGYVEVPVARTGEFVEFLTLTFIGTLTAGQMQDGIDITVGIQFAVSGTFVAGTTPQNNNTAISFMEGDATAQSFQMRAQSRNVGGFAPGISLSWGDYTGTETVGLPTGGGSSSEPMVMLGYNKWYQLRVRWKRSTGASANDGTTQVWINGQQVYLATLADNFYGAVGNLARLFGLGSSYSPAITGCKIRYCPPIKIRSVPDADCVPEYSWQDNTTDGRDLRRWYPALFAGTGSPWTFTGTATTPSLGSLYSVTGNIPGRARFVIPGTVGQTFTLNSPTIWSGSASDSILGETGWTWIRFADIYHGNNADVNLTVTASMTSVHVIEIKGSNNTLVVDGVTKQSGLSTSTRYEVLVGMRAGTTVILLHDISTPIKSSTMVRTYTVSNSWDGLYLDGVTISASYGGSTNVEIGPVGVYSNLRFIECDSYVGAAATSSVSITAVNTGTKTFTVSGDFSTVFRVGAKIVVSGSTGNNGTYTVSAVVYTPPGTHTTAFTVVEAVPSGVADGTINVSPLIQTASQRLGQFWNQGCDVTVPNGYDPCPTTGGLAGIDIALVLARSGSKLSESETYIWPTMVGFPIYGLLIGGVVNDITAANSTAASAWSEASSIANRIVRFAQWCEDSGGKSVIIDTLNLASGSGTGSYTTFSMSEPGMVAELLPFKLAYAGLRNGSTIHCHSSGMLEQNTDYQSSDGIHPGSNARAIIANAHHSAKAAQTWSGYNSNDGSIASIGSGGGSRSDRRGR